MRLTPTCGTRPPLGSTISASVAACTRAGGGRPRSLEPLLGRARLPYHSGSIVQPTSRPLVSIVTPSYNYGRFIEQCLESVKAQTYPSIEHIVMDACSTDETPRILTQHERPGLRAHFEKDRGQADALNSGFARAKGAVLCWLNADDYYLHPRVVEEAVAALADADVVTAGGWFVNDVGHRTRPIRVEPRRVVRELRFHDTILQPATFWRREMHRPLRADLHYTFDWQLFAEMRDKG